MKNKKIAARIKARAADAVAFAGRIRGEYLGMDLSPKRTSGGLGYVVHERGDGAPFKRGQTVEVLYVGLLASTGEVFDEAFSDGRPIRFRLGTGEVIGGWDIGIGLLSGGDKATLFIPPALGYGSEGVEGIPGGSELVFYVEV